jgi:histone acetyltransferase 1
MASVNRASSPPSKRVRFNSETPDSSPSRPSPETNSTGPSGLSSKLDANAVIELRFVRTAAQVGPYGASRSHTVPGLAAHPTFTHQIFPGGCIHGAASATAALYYTSASLECWVDVHSEALADDDGSDQLPTKIASTLESFVHAGLAKTREQFIATADADASYIPPFANEKADIAPAPSFESTSTSSSPLVHSYTAGEATFSVYKHRLNASAAITNYHKRMQLLMFMYIDGASFIDDTDPRWEVFAVFEHSTRTNAPHSLVGYATVYPFSAMRPGGSLSDGFAERIRVSQVFILPFYQRAGHGGRLLSAIYADAATRSSIEVTVEDPSEGFRLLRDTTDLPRAYRAGILDENKPISLPFVSDPDADAILITRMRTELLITKVQARRCLEIHQLRFVDRSDEDSYKKYRLWVKRRLHAEFLEVLDGFADKDRKTKLAEIYEDYEREYLASASRFRVVAMT